MEKIRRYSRLGQSVVEMTVFLVLIIAVFSMMVMYGQQLISQQQVKMQAFRKAKEKSYERNV